MEQMDFAMLRKVQGIHAPLRLQMERKATLKVGHLPFLPRHNASYNVLTGFTYFFICRYIPKEAFFVKKKKTNNLFI